MPATVNHVLTATTPDNTSYEIRPSHWNSQHVVSLSATGSEIIGAFTNSNNVSFGVNTAGVITASASYQSGISLSAGASVALLSAITFSNANGLSFGLSNGTLTGSYSQSTITTNGLISGVGVSASGNVGTYSGITLSNANSVTFGNINGVITASVSYPSQSSATFSNANGVSFGVAGGTVTASVSQSVQTQGPQAITLAGNTSGTLANVSSGTVTLAGGNNITLSQVGNAITISGPNIVGVQTGISAMSAGTTSVSSGTVVFSNANGVSFGFNGQTLTASIPPIGGVQTGISGVGVSNATFTSGTVNLVNANGISFGSSGANGISASYTVPTFVQSNQTIGVYVSSNTAFQSSSYTVDARNLTLVASGEISMGWSNSSLIISTPIGNFDSMGVSNIGNTAGNTGLLSQQAVLVGTNNITLNQSTGPNGSGTIYISGAPYQALGLLVSNTTITSGTISLQNANGISFGSSGPNGITASYTVPSLAGYLTGVGVSAGTTSSAETYLSFGNANGVSFGFSNGSITASIPSIPVQATGISGISVSNNVFTNGTVSFQNANGISFGSSGANGISASYTVPTQTVQPVAVSGSNGSFAFSTLSLGNLNGMSFYTSNGSVVGSYTTPAAGGVAQAAGTQTATSGTVAFSNSNNVTFGMSGSNVITASASFAQSTQPVAFSASNASATFATLSFANTNGATFIATNGSVGLSYTVPSTAGLLSAVNLSAGTASGNLTNWVYSNSNNVSFGLNGSTITASAAAQTVQTLGVYGVGQQVGTSSSTVDARSLSIEGTGGISVGWSAGSLIFSGNPYVSSVGVSNIGNTSGTTGAVSNQIVFAGGNNITLSQSTNAGGATITISGANIGGAQTGISGIVAGSQTQTSGTLSFANSNGVSFGLSNSSILTASFSTAPQSVQSIGIYASGNTTLTSSGTVDARTLAFSGSGLITVGYSNGTVIIGDSGSQSNQTIGFSALGNQTFTTTGTFDARSMALSAAGNITAGFSNGSMIVSGSQTPMLVGFNTLGNDTGATGFVSNQVQLVGGNNITLSGSLNANSMTITISGGGGIGAVAGTQTQLSGTLSFSNANGISFGLNGSSILTASYTVPTQSTQPVGISDSNGYTAFSTLSLGALNGMTLYGSNSSLVGSFTTAPNPVISAGTQVGNSTGTILFSNANNISFGMSNSSIITASYSQSVQPTPIYAVSQTTGQSSSSSYGNAVSIVGAGDVSVGWSNSSFIISGVGGTAGGGGNLGVYAVGTNTTGQTSSTYPASSLPIYGAGIISVGNSNGSLYISAPGTTSIALMSAGISNLGNYTGQTGAVASQLVLVGGNNITLSGSVSGGSATISFIGGAGTGGGGGASSVGFYANGTNTFGSTSSTYALSAIPIIGGGIISVGNSGGSLYISAPGTTSINLMSAGVSNLGNTSGTTGVVSGQLVFVGGSNVSLSASTNTNGFGTVTINAAGGTGGAGGSFSAGVSGGNTSGTTGTVSNQIVFAGGNNITLSQVTGAGGATITISGPNAGGAQTGISGIVAGTQTQTSGTLSFANSNGISFGLSNSSVLTASYTVPSTAGLLSAVNLSAGTTSGNVSNWVYSNSNNVSFGLNGSTITASVNTAATTAAYYFVGNTTGQSSSSTAADQTLSISAAGIISGGWTNGSLVLSATTAAQSVQTQASGAIAGTGFTSAGANVSLSGTLSTNGLSLSASVAAQSTQPVAISGSNGSFAFSTLTMGNLNGLSHYTSNGSLVASYTVPSTAGLISAVNLSAGTTSTNASAFTFSNSNGVSFGINGGTITASVAAGGAGFSAGVSGGNTSGNTGATGTQVVFAGGNNITLSQSTNANGATITISGANIGGAQTGISGIIAGTQTQTSGTLSFANSNGISFGLSNSSVITASYTVPSTAGLVSAINLSAGTTSTNASAFTFSNSNGLSFGLNGQTITGSYTVPSTAGLLSAVNLSAGTTSSNVSAFVFSNSNGVSFGLNGSTVTASVASQSVQTQASGAIAGTGFTSAGANISLSGTHGTNGLSLSASVAAQSVQTQNLVDVSLSGNTAGALALVSSGTLIFAGGNNITLSQNGQSITISGANAAGAQTGISGFQVSNTTYTSGTITLQNANGISFGSSGANGISASYTVPSTAGLISGINFSAGTTTTNGSGFTFSNSNNVSFGLNAGTVTASASFAQSVQTQASGAIAGSGFTSAGANISFSGTLSTNGLSLSASVAAQSAQPVVVSGSNGSFAFSTLTMGNLNGLSHYTSNGSLVASYTVPSTAGLISAINLSAGTTSSNVSNWVYSNSNGVSFGLNGNTITASYTVPSTAGLLSGVNFSVGTTSTNASQIVFSNANQGVTLGMVGNTITASADAYNIIAAGGSTAPLDSTVVFSNSNNVSFGLTNGTVLTASASYSNDGFNIVSMGTSTFGGATGGATYSASNGTIGLYAGSNITISQTSNSIIFYATSGGGGATSGSFFAAGNTTNNSSSTLALTSQVFQANGGVSLGFSNGSIQISAPVVSSITGIGLVSISTNGSTISVSGIGPIVSAGTTSSNLSNIVFSNSNGVSFGLSNGTITASANIVPLSYYEPAVRGQTATIQLAQPAMYFQPFVVSANIAMYRMQMIQNVTTQSASTYSVSASISAGNASSGSGTAGTTGTVALFSRQGTGTINPNSNILLSFYSNTYSLSLGEYASISWSTNGSSATASYTRSGAFGYIANINSTGGITTSSATTSVSTTFSSTSTNANSFSFRTTNTFGSLMMSNSRPIIVPFNTALTPGEYWLGHQQSTQSGSTNIAGMNSVVNMPQGILYFTTNNQGYLELGQTVSNPNSNIQQGWGSLTSVGSTSTTVPMASILGGNVQAPNQLWFNMAAAIK